MNDQKLMSHLHKKEYREIFGTDGYDYHFDCGNGILLYAYMQTCQNVYSKYVHFHMLIVPK